MKNLKINQFDTKDEEIVEVLISLGMGRPAARMLAYIQQVNEAKSIELEMGTGLRQPEVSIATKQLKERDLISERNEKKLGKGRPYKLYTLKVGFKDIIAHLEKQQKNAFDGSQEKIESLKELGK
jgi:predicted transcriptional regulator